MWQIITNEWRYLSRTKSLLVISFSFIIILLAAAWLGYKQNKVHEKNYAEAKQYVRAEWEAIKEMNPHGAAHYGTYVFKPTQVLSGLDDGVNAITGNVLRVEGHVQNEMVHSEASQMQSVSKFGKLKGALLLQYIVPLLLIFLSYHAINSEKQSGRLKMLIFQGSRLRTLVVGKTIAIWLYGFSLLLLTILVYLIFHAATLHTDVWLRTFLLLFSYSVYYFVLCGLTLFLSLRIQQAAVALTCMLTLWVVWSIFMPNILQSAVSAWHPLPSRNVFKQAMKEDRSKGIDGHNPSEEREKEFRKEVLAKYGVDSVEKLPINIDGLLMQADEEYGNIVWDKHFGELRNTLAQQKQSYQLGGIINPFISLQNASMGFAGSDNYHHQHYLLQVETYRRMFIKMLNDKHAFGGSKSGDWDWKADNAFFKSVPDFEYQESPIQTSLTLYLTDIAWLLFWFTLVFILLLFGTHKLTVL
jgi:ABC-2 type transport system permease protein